MFQKGIIIENIKTYNNYTVEDLNTIKVMYEQGFSQEKIAKSLNFSPKRVSKIMKVNNIHIRTNREQALKYTVNEHYFDNIDTEEKAYWLGFFYADGYVNNKTKHSNYKIGITLTKSDKQHLEKFKKSIEYTGNICNYQPSKINKYNSKPYCKIMISSKQLGESLFKQGCVLNKTYILNFPSTDQVPKKLIRHFIRGLVDGDGSVMYKQRASYIKKNTKVLIHPIEVTLSLTGTSELLTGVLNEFEMRHLKLDQRFKERNNNNYSIKIGGNKKVFRVLDWLYKDATVYLDRKYEKYINAKQLYEEFKVEFNSDIKC